VLLIIALPNIARANLASASEIALVCRKYVGLLASQTESSGSGPSVDISMSVIAGAHTGPRVNEESCSGSSETGTLAVAGLECPSSKISLQADSSAKETSEGCEKWYETIH
jgi:hypothetical protein